jgi:hypothetical protein
MKEKPVTLELVVLVKAPHLVRANGYKCSPLELFVQPCLNSIWLSLSEILRNNRPLNNISISIHMRNVGHTLVHESCSPEEGPS